MNNCVCVIVCINPAKNAFCTINQLNLPIYLYHQTKGIHFFNKYLTMSVDTRLTSQTSLLLDLSNVINAGSASLTEDLNNNIPNASIVNQFLDFQKIHQQNQTRPNPNYETLEMDVDVKELQLYFKILDQILRRKYFLNSMDKSTNGLTSHVDFLDF